MLPERSRTKTISVGLEEISGAAESASVTFSVPLQLICVASICLLELVTPIVLPADYDFLWERMFPGLSYDTYVER